MNRATTAETLLSVVETFRFANEEWIFVKIVFITRWHTPTLAFTSLPYIATTKIGHYTHQLNKFQMMVLPLSTIVVTKWHIDLPWCGTTNHWCSFDAHFRDGAGSMSLVFLPLKVTNTSFMNVYNKSAVRLPKMLHPKLMILCWRSVSGWGRERVAILLASKSCQYQTDGCLQSIAS